MSEIINEVSRLVEDVCKKETNFFTYDIWQYHIVDVVKYSKILAIKLNADIEIVVIAALLHDYAGINDYSKQEKHHLYGAEDAELILKNLAYPQEKIDKVKECIVSIEEV